MTAANPTLTPQGHLVTGTAVDALPMPSEWAERMLRGGDGGEGEDPGR